ncbi:ThuA domain-containing protein [Microbacterium phyllosphaerae]|uniref:ThuA domain-containing protein n=1 Tax=Microbacterium phyllosphaerae TaxID=124798 RepID=UPI003D65DA61
MTDRPALIVTGVGAHADPWHGLAATSTALAGMLAERMPVRHLDTDEIANGATLTGAALIVVNISGDLATDAAPASAVLDPLLDAVAAGIPLLAVHSSSLAFRDDPRWAELLGGRWVPGSTMHPQIGWSLVQPTAPLAPFRVYDERYSHLEVDDGSALRAIHTDDGITHALAWSRRGADGHGGAAYSALGHGVEAYRSAGTRALLHALIGELLGTTHTAIETPDASAASRDLEAAALDYELIALAPHGSEIATTGFADRFDDGELLASGYLLLERLPTGCALHSHGREVGRVASVDGGLRVDLPGAEIDGRMLRAADAGIALIAESGEWQSDGAGSAILLGEDWRVVVVHGPAPVKLDNRVRLLDDLRAVRETQREQNA